ncbi:MAG: hypothetical protein ACE5Q6_13005 [Dehalococcoidia bacterium]
MRMKMFQWLGREFVSLSCEGTGKGTTLEETQDIFRRLDKELQGLDLSLDHTVRTRLWGRDRESRDIGSSQRVKTLSGRARSSSSSYIAPDFFASEARVSLDLLAMRPVNPDADKVLKEYDPPIVPLRYLVYDSIVFLSGVTAVLPTLGDQLDDILPRIQDSLANAGSSWEQVARVSFFLHRSQKISALKKLFGETVKAEIPQAEYAFVDGYSSEGKLIEVEVTAEGSRTGA